MGRRSAYAQGKSSKAGAEFERRLVEIHKGYQKDGIGIITKLATPTVGKNGERKFSARTGFDFMGGVKIQSGDQVRTVPVGIESKRSSVWTASLLMGGATPLVKKHQLDALAAWHDMGFLAILLWHNKETAFMTQGAGVKRLIQIYDESGAFEVKPTKVADRPAGWQNDREAWLGRTVRVPASDPLFWTWDIFAGWGVSLKLPSMGADKEGDGGGQGEEKRTENECADKDGGA